MTFFGIVGLFSLSFVLGLAVIFAARKFNVGADSHTGVQRFHTHWAPRLGGVPIYICLALWIMLVVDEIQPDFQRSLLWVLCLTPAFLVGLIEDLTQKVGSWPRLMTTMFGAALAWWLLNAQVVRLGLPPLDGWLAATPIASLLITMLFVGGAAHSVNIIDGYNGLASSYALVVLLAILVVAGKVHDIKLMYTTVGAITATLGFFVLNFPSGRIFLGDSGAYLLGTVIAFLLTILVNRNPDVSPMFAAVLLVYPVWETLFSIYRKKFLRGMSPMQPDGMHLHMLLYKRLVRTNVDLGSGKRKIQMNSATTLYALTLSGGTATMAITFWQNTAALFSVFWLFIAGYVMLYSALVRFRAPSRLSIRNAWSASTIRVAEPFRPYPGIERSGHSADDAAQPVASTRSPGAAASKQ
jgi:UDP-N-acetylmuramyl pentapeptide phosphotransferase/UDP-N-acetylglucosamine-1-phosphate transferase